MREKLSSPKGKSEVSNTKVSKPIKVLNSLKEILVDRQNCLLIKNFNDEKEWYKVIKFVCNNFKKYEKIRRNAYNYSKKFNQDWRVSELLTFEKFSK